MLNLKFINLYTCGCNIGHCSAVLDYDIVEYLTYGDILKKRGHKCESELLDEYYEYPDSVYFMMEKVQIENLKIYRDGCSGNPISFLEANANKPTPVLNDNNYVTIAYCR